MTSSSSPTKEEMAVNIAWVAPAVTVISVSGLYSCEYRLFTWLATLCRSNRIPSGGAEGKDVREKDCLSSLTSPAGGLSPDSPEASAGMLAGESLAAVSARYSETLFTGFKFFVYDQVEKGVIPKVTQRLFPIKCF